jgi:Tol biopolymer transport system component
VATALPGTENATGPFWSPDGKHLGFFTSGKLMRVTADGAVAQKVADVSSYVTSGTWNRDDVILFSYGGGDGLFRVPAEGGEIQPATTLDAARGDLGHRWPQFLPDGRRFLFYLGSTVPEHSGVYLGSLDDEGATMILRSRANAVYAPPGYLLFDHNSHLAVQAIDDQSGTLQGEPVVLPDHVVGARGPSFLPVSAGANGTVAYWDGALAPTELQWIDRAGRVESTVEIDGQVLTPALSPDGARLAITKRDGASDWIWRVDLETGLDSRVTFTGDERYPIWSHDGKFVVYTTRYSLYRKAVSGAGEETLIAAPPGHWSIMAEDWSRDGRWLVYGSSVRTGWDVGAIDMESGQRTAIVDGLGNQVQARLSPDGEWIAYASDESGAWEVYVEPFPEGAGKWQVSAAGGSRPAWRGDGNELFYVDAEGVLVAVPAGGSEAFESGPGTPLFQTRMHPVAAPYRGTYSVTPDGQRFLVETLLPAADPSTITVVLDWPAALRDAGDAPTR